MHGLCPASPYPVKHYRGFMLPFTREFGFLAVSECKRVLIWFVVRVDIQRASPSLSTWLARWWTWIRRLWCGWSSLVRSFCVYPVHEELVEVAYEWCQQQEHSVLCHGGLWQPCPSEAIVTPHSRRHRSRHLTKNPQSRCTDSRTMCTEVPGLCRLPDPQNGKNAPSREIFLQKEWFSQILCLPLPCHWWFLLVLKCSH